MIEADVEARRSAVRAEYRGLVRGLTRIAMQRDQYADLAGEPSVDLVELREVLVEEAVEVEALRTHVCQWNDDDYCSVCAADGRA